MRLAPWCVLLLGLLAIGCNRQKSTPELLSDLKSSEEKDRMIAVRLLGQRKGDPAELVPALVDALKDRESDIRRSAALGLGNLGEEARDAIPALQAAQRDRDARVREAATLALSRIDPTRFPETRKGK